MRGQVAGSPDGLFFQLSFEPAYRGDLLLLPDLNHDPPHFDHPPSSSSRRWLPCWLGAPTPTPDPAARRLDSTLRFRNADIVTALARRAGHPPPRRRASSIARPTSSTPTWASARCAPVAGARRARPQRQRPGPGARRQLVREPPGRAPRQPRTICGAAPRPRRAPPFRVVGTKLGGISPGMRVSDASGSVAPAEVRSPRRSRRRDRRRRAAAAAAVGRGLPHPRGHASCYLRAEDLVLDPKAKLKDLRGNERRMTSADLRDGAGPGGPAARRRLPGPAEQVAARHAGGRLPAGGRAPRRPQRRRRPTRTGASCAARGCSSPG